MFCVICINKRWQDCTEELYKKGLNDPDNDGSLPQNWISWNVKSSGAWDELLQKKKKSSVGDGVPVELFKILRDDAVKVLHSICQQIWKSAVAIGPEKVSFHSSPKEGQSQRMFKLLYNCTHFICQQGYAQNPSSQASKIL